MPDTLRLALAQLNPTVGDLAGNAGLIAAAATRARAEGAEILLTPEMALTGYPPEDLLLDPTFRREAAVALGRLARDVPRDLATIVGTVTEDRDGLHNAAVVLWGSRIRAVYHKHSLPNNGVFDERRYFTPGRRPLLLNVRGWGLGVTICEDVWHPGGPAREAARSGASWILNLSASPFHAGKMSLRRRVLRAKVRECGAGLAYANLTGGQDEVVHDGGSLVMDARGRLVMQAPQFEEGLWTIDLPASPRRKGRGAVVIPLSVPASRPAASAPRTPALDPVEEVHRALVLGTRDYVRKNGFSHVVVGLSGGIDSALVAALAVDALGPDHVIGVTLPSRFNAADTRADAETLAENLGIVFHTLPIEPIVQAFLQALSPLFGDRPRDVTEENLQSRVRGTLLMALSNKFGWLVLTTGNKSEVSAGYFTLYGDSAGGFAPLRDVPKTLVYALSRRVNAVAGRDVIPDSVLTRPPTAELRENQKDQDTLPPYDVLDSLVRCYVEENRSLAELRRAGIDEAVARRWTRTIDAAEYKRRQAPPGIKITPRAFGRDRRMPITNRFRRDAVGEKNFQKPSTTPGSRPTNVPG
jgi:NAD+ synthase (glutamine-hydrolysing)